MSGTEIPFEGVIPLDHTADVGLEVRADDLSELFLRAALGMTHLILEAPLPEPEEGRMLRVVSDDLPGLLRNWLRELLYLHEVEGAAFVDAEFVDMDPTGLEATVRTGPDPAPPAREIKGVTLHGLDVHQEVDGGWYARVIFDV